MMQGKVVTFYATRGYGFIETGNGDKIFIHRDHINSNKPFKTLEAGQRVTFGMTNTLGSQATDVTVVPLEMSQ